MKHRSILERDRITQELSVDFLQSMSDRVAREWDEKQARLKKQRDENRKRLFPALWRKEQRPQEKEHIPTIETTMQILKQLCEEEKPLGPNQRRTESGQVYTVVNKSRIPTS